MKDRRIVLLLDVAGSYGREIIVGVKKHARKHSKCTIVMEPWLWNYPTFLLPDLTDVDGLIVHAFDDRVVDQVRETGLPAINVCNIIPGRTQLPTVIPDDAAIGRMAAEYLLSLELKNFAYCGYNLFQFSLARQKSFTQRIEAAGFTVDSCDDPVSGLEGWLNRLVKPSGIFCCNDLWAHRVLNTLIAMGIHVPDECSVLGVDDDELLNTVGSLPLSSISLPAERIGFEAASLLQGAIAGKPPPAQTLIQPTGVASRATTDATQVDDIVVAKAARFIRDHSYRQITVEEVVAHAVVSRRSLDERFRAALSRSIATEIRISHLERAKRLLKQSTLSLDQAAAASGFIDAAAMSATFRRFLGISPTKYRNGK